MSFPFNPLQFWPEREKSRSERLKTERADVSYYTDWPGSVLQHLGQLHGLSETNCSSDLSKLTPSNNTSVM